MEQVMGDEQPGGLLRAPRERQPVALPELFFDLAFVSP